MNRFNTLVALVSMAIVIGSVDASYEIQTNATLVDNPLQISCTDENAVLTFLDAWYGNSANCTKATANDPTIDGRSVCCRNVMPQIERMIGHYEDYYQVDNDNTLVGFVNAYSMDGDDCPNVKKILWVEYICKDPIA